MFIVGTGSPLRRVCHAKIVPFWSGTIQLNKFRTEFCQMGVILREYISVSYPTPKIDVTPKLFSLKQLIECNIASRRSLETGPRGNCHHTGEGGRLIEKSVCDRSLFVKFDGLVDVYVPSRSRTRVVKIGIDERSTPFNDGHYRIAMEQKGALNRYERFQRNPVSRFISFQEAIRESSVDNNGKQGQNFDPIPSLIETIFFLTIGFVLIAWGWWWVSFCCWTL